MTVIARFVCHHVDRWSNHEIVHLMAIYSPDPNSPNHSWSQATPSGKIEMTINNQAAFGAFVPGVEYDITFSPRKASGT